MEITIESLIEEIEKFRENSRYFRYLDTEYCAFKIAKLCTDLKIDTLLKENKDASEWTNTIQQHGVSCS